MAAEVFLDDTRSFVLALQSMSYPESAENFLDEQSGVEPNLQPVKLSLSQKPADPCLEWKKNAMHRKEAHSVRC